MDETILFPSQNWFLSSVLAVTADGWLVYGGPSKSLCILEPLPPDSKRVLDGHQGYRAHVAKNAHAERITCVDISPDWPTKRLIMTGSMCGMVKQWLLEEVDNNVRIKCALSHDLHRSDKEEVIGVGYCNNGYAVTVGSFGPIVKWDLTSNVMKTYNHALKNFKPTCMACSPHKNLHVAIGTKQGVVFVLDLNGASRLVYKVRAQDDEIIKLSWCPQMEVIMRKALSQIQQRKTTATKRMEKIRQEPESEEFMKELDERVKQSESVQHFMDDKSARVDDKSEEPSDDQAKETQNPNESGTVKTLPEDSFDETVVQEDDMFDIYKDHEADEFGHKKYEPEEIRVKIPEEKKEEDYLTECQKLKEDILKRKNEPEPSIEALVDAMDKAHVDEAFAGTNETSEAVNDKKAEDQHSVSEATSDKENVEEVAEVNAQDGVTSVHIQRDLLASASKHGSIRIFSKNGKMVASCQIPSSGGSHNQKQKNRGGNAWTTILWYKPDMLLIGDGKNNLLQCNPLKIDCKNKLEYSLVHSLHKRGLFCVASNAPRSQKGDCGDQASNWFVWTTSQDRYLIKYSVELNKVVASYNTCGGFVYYVQPCPYDANRVAISVGDGAVRVWSTEPQEDDETRLTLGKVDSFWQNVQGKVLVVAWHPTKEFRLAFATGENRIGVLDTSKPEKPAKLLQPVLNGGIYSMCWGEGGTLYACGGGEMVVYNADRPDDAPTPVHLEHERQKLSISAVRHYPTGLVIGTTGGAVALVTATTPYTVEAAVFVFNKMIHTVEWHPPETSNSTGESSYKNLLAVCSSDKSHDIVIVEYAVEEEGGKQLKVNKTLKGHSGLVNQVAWNPHIEAQLLSTSQDGTVRIWSVVEGTCISIFGSHGGAALGAAWAALPDYPALVVSGGTDCCLRLWEHTYYPADQFQEMKHEVVFSKKDKKKKNKAAESTTNPEDEEEEDTENKMATLAENSARSSKKFLLPLMYKQTNPCPAKAARRMLKKYLESSGDSIAVDIPDASDDRGLDFLKIFGSTNDVNELLNNELERQQDTGNIEAWLMMHVFRGHIDAMVQYASQRNCLDPYLLSITPCVSLKYWKDATQLYLAQIDRLVAKGEEKKLAESKNYGGPIYRKAASLLSVHDVVAAVRVLTDANLYKEAYMLCRTRYMDSVAQEVLQRWAYFCIHTGNFNMAAVCFIVLGELSHATKVLGNSNEEDSLCLAADIAKILGQATYAKHIDKKREEIITNKENTQIENDSSETLEELPSRAELILKEIDNALKKKDENGSGDAEKVLEELPARMEKKEDENGSGDTEKVLEELPAKMEKLTTDSEQFAQNKGSFKNTEEANVDAMAGITKENESGSDTKEYL